MEVLIIKKFISSKYSFFIVIFLAVILFNLYSYLSRTKSNKIIISTSYNDKIITDSISVTSEDTVDFNINFQYQGNDKHKYDLTLYWDYNQTEFNVDNTKYTAYPIDTKGDYCNKQFKVKLDKKFNNKVHKLVVVIQDRDLKSKIITSMSTPYTFIVNNSSTENSLSLKSPFKVYADNVGYLNVVNTDFVDNTQKYETFINVAKDRVLEVSPNTNIELAFRFKNFVNTGEQLILFELNNNQILIDDKVFLTYNLDPNIGFIYDKIKITTPTKPGVYRLKTSIVANPFDSHQNKIYESDFAYKLVVK